jgi:Mn-dependent DtxR family transcriptional regulator
MANIRTLIKSSLQSDRSGMRVANLADSIGSSYSSTYQALKNMEAEGQVRKVGRGVYTLAEIPTFTTAECISLLQSLENQEIAVEIAREELDRAEAQLQAVKRTIKATMMSAFED